MKQLSYMGNITFIHKIHLIFYKILPVIIYLKFINFFIPFAVIKFYSWKVSCTKVLLRNSLLLREDVLLLIKLIIHNNVLILKAIIEKGSNIKAFSKW